MLKGLIEVTFRLKEVSEHSARDKSMRHGHISAKATRSFFAFSSRDATVGGRASGMPGTGRGEIRGLACHVLNRTGGHARSAASSPLAGAVVENTRTSSLPSFPLK